ncbi:uncharacterized protein LOC115587554 [Sparus aurata]|uniref:uncharacterized protein LOC115587554 n=1 Tax=Sparus aurata TaxID=8175 RepID=UPI0011C18539|nr:uncharacterized protein LOC115587554 [Sparus aurata]
MFGAEIASRFLKKCTPCFKDNVIQEAKALRETSLLKKQLKSALNEESDTADEPEWDSDMASLLVLLHLLTPQPAGRKRPKKISVEEATDHLVKFQKSCQSLEDHLITTEGNPQPYLLAQVSSFYIILDRKLLPCRRKRPKPVNPADCEFHSTMDNFPFSRIVSRRTRNGIREVKVKWVPCPQCHLRWADSWVTQDDLN